jgi:hypothetical protein
MKRRRKRDAGVRVAAYLDIGLCINDFERLQEHGLQGVLRLPDILPNLTHEYLSRQAWHVCVSVA